MKCVKIHIVFILLAVSLNSFAQQTDGDEQKGKFKLENIFLGSSLNFGVGSHSFNVGLNPEIGYSITKWFDAGIAFNVNYFSQSVEDYTGSVTKFKNFSYGGGPLVRIWPINFLYVQVQPEYNFTTFTARDVATNLSNTTHTNVGSLLVGVGYGTKILGSHYSYLSLMIDVLQNINSPYRDHYTNDPLPVFRAGFGFYLKPRHQ
jgi:hypothetical protein